VRSEKVKRIARELVRRNPGKFTAEFVENKKLIESLVSIASKRLRNTIAGYVTHLAVLSQSGTSEEDED
jgi:small subunit ribosomal protein S17e